MSEDRGARMDSPASKAEIQRFLKAYEGQVAVNDIADPLDSFPSFNAFFYRKLKAGSRPIADPTDNCVLTSAADCRLMAFDSVVESQKFWIKVQAALARLFLWFCAAAMALMCVSVVLLTHDAGYLKPHALRYRGGTYR
jgi:phosphatidylserine decarboxylase